MADSNGNIFINRDQSLPFFKPDVGEEEISAVAEVLRSGWLTYGPKVREFGQACAEYLDVPCAVPVASCSAGLFLTLKAMGIGPGDEVILPSMTFIATLTAVIHCGARPVLADMDPDNLGLDPEAFARAITPRTKAVIPVHLAGHPCRIKEIITIAGQHGIKVMEDAAHSFGAAVDGTRIGGFGDATVFSFYATKCITTGDGGLVTTANQEMADKLQLLSFHGMDGNAWQRYGDKGRWYYEVVALGYKFHLGDPAAALGLVQLGRSDAFMARRTEVAMRFNAAFADLPGVTLPGQADWATHAWHLYVLRLDPDVIDGGRDGLIEDLTANRIGSSVHFIPLHHHPAYRKEGAEFISQLPETEKYYSQAVSLPLFPGMLDSDVEDVIEVVTGSLKLRTR
ncbi:MAG: DegT/DnrJ/EryC1/StrS family aminotransferase [Candidatus Krumholzibacteria bacterium]|nr:DegT/DnrJ/EryC1/StrS family aminotransferase [Candidatus Krumholzibacteria bacterium]